MSHIPADNPLGQATSYPDSYSPDLLFSVPRVHNRSQIGIVDSDLPFYGYDLWHAFELSWLDMRGKPVVAVAELLVPCESPYIIESKSLKLYLNSLNQMRYPHVDNVQELISRDLSKAAGLPVLVRIQNIAMPAESFGIAQPSGICLDDIDLETEVFEPDASLLKLAVELTGDPVSEKLYSNLFKSNCPVTGQPDWGTVVIDYKGQPIDHATLLRYIVSYRNHQGFHEHCAEMIFNDILQHCQPESLTLVIHFLRRGGLDINPVRSTSADADTTSPTAGVLRFIRQ